jgi:hypothetical protein
VKTKKGTDNLGTQFCFMFMRQWDPTSVWKLSCLVISYSHEIRQNHFLYVILNSFSDIAYSTLITTSLDGTSITVIMNKIWFSHCTVNGGQQERNSQKRVSWRGCGTRGKRRLFIKQIILEYKSCVAAGLTNMSRRLGENEFEVKELSLTCDRTRGRGDDSRIQNTEEQSGHCDIVSMWQ